MDSIKDVVQSSVKVLESDKHLKKAGAHIGQNVVEITIKMKTIVWKPLKIKIIKFHFRNLDNEYLSVTKKILFSFPFHIHVNWHFLSLINIECKKKKKKKTRTSVQC